MDGNKRGFLATLSGRQGSAGQEHRNARRRPGHSARRRFCAKDHSSSIHCASQRKPVRSAISGTSSALYLWELSVQIVSSSLRTIRKLAAGMRTLCRHVERKCISMRRSVRIPAANLRIVLNEDETIWTESSHKYKAEEVPEMAERTGFRCDAQWIDDEWSFAQNLLLAE